MKTALTFCWDNIRPALPKKIGVAQLVDICELGCKHYVENFPSFLKPPSEWGPVRKARVMVKDADWFGVAQGLLEAGVFGMVPESEVFRVNSKLLLNGLFRVEKHEEAQGVPVYRLIMNLVPLNELCQGMAGDIQTLPHGTRICASTNRFQPLWCHQRCGVRCAIPVQKCCRWVSSTA